MQDKAIKELENLQEMAKDLEPEEVVDLGVIYLRKRAYDNYPTANPMVVEALLLMYKSMCYQWFEAVDQDIDVWRTNLEEEYQKLAHECQRFGIAMDKTLKQMTA